MTTIYSLNLSDPELEPLSHAPFHFADKTVEINKLEEVPEHGPAIIYILAHAVPNGLRAGPAEDIVTEDKIASILKQRRRHLPTLLIIDACFAESFRKLASGENWPSQLALIFSCLAFERSWHSDVSLFSLALNEVMSNRVPIESTLDLQAELRKRMGELQTPVVVEAPVELLRQILISPQAA